jgi:prepilin-type N-terminal cleavage/methylation domain-containing protein
LILHPSSFRSSFILRGAAPRRGVTLMELLLVITIILMMMVAAARQMQAAKDLRRSREAARAVSAYLGAARSRALANHRPCGVMLVSAATQLSAGTATGLQNCVMTLQQVEVPPPYAGDTTNATATVSGSGGTYQANFPQGAAQNLQNLVHKGDKIQFGYEGPWYVINANPQSSSSATFTLDPNDLVSSQCQQLPWGSSGQSSAMPFRIKRQPMVLLSSGTVHANKSLAAPLQLPAGSVIDLSCSDTPSMGSEFSSSSSPVCIVFGASGAIDSVFFNGTSSLVSQPIYLMVGKPDKARGLAAAPAGAQNPNYYTSNWADLDNKWVVINPQTGLVTTAPVGSTTNSVPNSASDSRGLANQAELLGGW